MLITGGTGSVGRVFCDFLIEKGFSAHVLTRNKKKASQSRSNSEGKPVIRYFYWDVDKSEIDPQCFENVISIVHLAGERIFGLPWIPSRKKRIKASRIDSLDFLFSKIPSWQRPFIESLISASAIGIYEANTSHLLHEYSNYGQDFLAQVCIEWENKVQELAELNGIREVRFRNGLVLDSSRGVYPLLDKLSKNYLLTTPGNGRQLVPWIHVEDIAANLVEAVLHTKYEGAYNMVAPEYINMQHLTEQIAKWNEKKMLVKNVPEKFIKFFLGEMSGLILNSYLVSPERLTKLGYQFRYPNLGLAVGSF